MANEVIALGLPTGMTLHAACYTAALASLGNAALTETPSSSGNYTNAGSLPANTAYYEVEDASGNVYATGSVLASTLASSQTFTNTLSANQTGDAYAPASTAASQTTTAALQNAVVGVAHPMNNAALVFQAATLTNVPQNFPATIDGVSATDFLNGMLAFIAGMSTESTSGSSTTITFKRQDGTTSAISVTYTTATGARTAAAIP